VLDFTSALYLGMHHTTGALRPWRSLTTGRPAALAEPPGAAAVVNHLADLVGCERATLLPSTLHLFWDLFGRLDARNWRYLWTTEPTRSHAGALSARWGEACRHSSSRTTMPPRYADHATDYGTSHPAGD
jgi:8-amino-7-oxononanoate synthase